ncbi:predicted protein [Thalassiosira pseudonana CCMP1335]|uniref:Uncharacterized protein n=1 Tax=Thalassiosira pseudonana TaxID=35128 RepID=B8BTT9_THAPS|nr:predicted protein [Thalassiosira pseudonana CCMP1335]EED95156.1 predicted protein [Thalassiosira pseudonana CCMP1335]
MADFTTLNNGSTNEITADGGVGLTLTEELNCKDKVTSRGLPQDYFSPNEVSSIVEEGSPASCFAANAHPWVSPNKSDEIASSKDSTPTTNDENTKKASKSPVDTLSTKASSDSENEYSDEEFDSPNKSPSMRVIGNRIESAIKNTGIPPLDLSTCLMESDLIIDASGKDWIKVVHGDKEIMMVLPASGSTNLASSFEVQDTLTGAFNINDNVEIVGLSTSALLQNNDDKTHGEIVFPFFAVVSGQLKDIIRNAEGIPSFGLVTKTMESMMFGTHQDHELATFANAATDFKYDDDDEESSMNSMKEGFLYTDAFIELMESSDEFNAFEKNALIRFGLDSIESGSPNLLIRAAFRTAVYTEELSHFVNGLKSIAALILQNKAFEPATKSIFGLVEFVATADALFENEDLSTKQYITLVDAIFSGHEEVEKLFDLYCCPDFLLACESGDSRQELLFRDLLNLSTMLTPIEKNSEERDDNLLKWAVHTGIHNLSTRVLMPQEFINIIYHMFSSGDEFVLEACKEFVASNDSDVVEDMLLREFGIYCKNRERLYKPFDELEEQFKEKNATAEVVEYPDALVKLASIGSDDTVEEDIPDLLLTAVAALVDLEEMGEDSATAIVASYMKGNVLLRDIYDRFVEHGDTEEFLFMLKTIASTDQFDSIRSDQPPLIEEEPSIATLSTVDTFRIKEDTSFGALEIAALRLASARKDEFLADALAVYTETRDYEGFKNDLMAIVAKVIFETDATLEEEEASLS